MADYYGLEAIAKRMGVCVTTILVWRRHRGFLLYRRRKHLKTCWYTNDALIFAWEYQRALREHAEPLLKPKTNQIRMQEERKEKGIEPLPEGDARTRARVASWRGRRNGE